MTKTHTEDTRICTITLKNYFEKLFENNSSLQSFVFQWKLSTGLIRNSVTESSIGQLVLSSNTNFESFSSSFLT